MDISRLPAWVDVDGGSALTGYTPDTLRGYAHKGKFPKRVVSYRYGHFPRRKLLLETAGLLEWVAGRAVRRANG